MGINGFSKFFSPVIQTKCISELRNKIVIVDATYIIYKYCIAIRNSGKDYVNKNGDLSSHLLAIFNIASFLLKNKITPIFVFDGKTPSIKKDTTSERKKKKNKANDEILLNNNATTHDDEYIKNFKRSFHLNEIHYLESQILLTSMGITYVVAPEEADAQCAALSKLNLNNIGGIISEDSDILVFGGTKLIKNLNIKNKTYDEYDLDNILDYMLEIANLIRDKNNLKRLESITQKNFITYCILLGNDYIDNIKNLKFDTIFENLVISNFDLTTFIELIKDKIISRNNNFNIDNYIINYKEKFNQVYEYYLNSQVYDPNDIYYNIKPINKHLLNKIMCETHNFDSNFIKHELCKIQAI